MPVIGKYKINGGRYCIFCRQSILRYLGQYEGSQPKINYNCNVLGLIIIAASHFLGTDPRSDKLLPPVPLNWVLEVININK